MVVIHSNVEYTGDRYVASYPPEELNTEFKRKYPPDPFGEETSANARVWKVYKDEATAHDKSLLDGWNKTLDILLIFAGLFSAVATAFVIESYKLLQPDYEEYIAGALFAALSSRNGSGALDQALDLQDPNDFVPLRASRWLNGIWFTSLVLSLVVAFLCILLKQCIEEYSSRVSAPFPSLRHWSRRRTFYFDGMTEWALPVFVAILPLLLHAAVFLFLTGLALLLWSLDSINAAWILAVTSALLLFYVVSIVVPFLRPSCPSSTPIPRLLSKSIHLTHLRILSVVSQLAVREQIPLAFGWSPSEGPCTRLTFYVQFPVQYLILLVRRSIRYLLPAKVTEALTISYWKLRNSLTSSRAHLAGSRPYFLQLSKRETDRVDAYALRWLITTSPSSSVVSVGFQAIGSLSPWSPVVDVLRCASDLQAAVRRCLQDMYPRMLSNQHVMVFSEADVARDFRSAVCVW
ncbi:hypothetical protein EXIGLDRAFT_665432, partial [Exidia glandulosa HHB12029]